MIIPKKTGKIQPYLRIYCRIWKNFAKRFSDTVLLLESNINLHERNNIIIKLQSLIYNQLSFPRYHNLFKYSWFKSGYTNGKSEENPVELSFDKSSTTCAIESCMHIAVVKCS